MIIRKTILAACSVASKADANRPALQGVKIDGDKAIAADGFVLIQVPAVECEEGDYEGLLLPSKRLAELVKANKKARCIRLAEDGSNITGIGGVAGVIEPMESGYPDYKKQFQTTAPLVSVAFDAKRMRDLLDAIILSEPDGPTVVLHIHSAGPLTLLSHNDAGTTTALIMPIGFKKDVLPEWADAIAP